MIQLIFENKRRQKKRMRRRCGSGQGRVVHAEGLGMEKNPSEVKQDGPKGHHFKKIHFHTPTWCRFCSKFIWGVGKQGYECSRCEYPAHKECVRKIPVDCAGVKNVRFELQASASNDPVRKGSTSNQELRKAAANGWKFEEQSIRVIWSHYDKNNSGKLDAKETKKFLAEFLALANYERDIQLDAAIASTKEMIAQAKQTPGSPVGDLEKSLTGLVESKGKMATPEFFAESQKALDADGNGTVTFDEFMKFLSTWATRPMLLAQDTGVRNGKVTKEAALRYLKNKWGTSLPESMFNQEWIKIDPLSKKEATEVEYDKLCAAIAARVRDAMLRQLEESQNP